MKKLKIGDIVSAKFLGTTYKCVVIEVTDKNIYKLRMKYSDTILPSAQWKKHSKKGAPWFIESLIESKTNVKSTKSKDIKKNTTDKKKLKKAIENQKKFVSGKLSK